MTEYSTVVPNDPLGLNPILKDLILRAQAHSAQHRRGPMTLDLHPNDARWVAPLLQQQVQKATDLTTALNCLEAATAEELYRQNENVYWPIALAALRRAYLKYRIGREYVGPGPAISFVRLVCERSFWGKDGQRFGRATYCRRQLWQPDWHADHEIDMARLMRAFVKAERIKSEVWLTTIEQLFRPSRAPAAGATTTPNQVSYIDLTGPFQLRHVWLVRINRPDELAFVMRGLETIEHHGMAFKRGDDLFNRGLTMFRDGLAYCAERGVVNARAVFQSLFGTEAQRRRPVEIMKLLDLAEQITGSPAPTRERAVLNVPWAMDVIGDAIAYRGRNTLSAAERQNVAIYFRLVGDVCTLGEYFRDKHFKNRTIGDYLTAHPRVDPEVFADRINPERREARGHSNPAYQAARTRFGSTFYAARNRSGYGFRT